MNQQEDYESTSAKIDEVWRTITDPTIRDGIIRGLEHDFDNRWGTGAYLDKVHEEANAYFKSEQDAFDAGTWRP